MTRDEFLDRFIERSGIPKACRTPDGIKDGKFERIAVECHCGAYDCIGWELVKPEIAKPKIKVTTP